MTNPFIIFKNFIKRKLVEFLYPEIDKIMGEKVGKRLEELRRKK